VDGISVKNVIFRGAPMNSRRHYSRYEESWLVSTMSMKRITISLDEKLVFMLKNKQADFILEENKPVSISSVVGLLLERNFKTDETINDKLDLIFTRQN